jgi:DNA-binding FadR family transcriptional regulator
VNKVSEHINEQIRSAIFEEKLIPGDKLPCEKEAVKKFKGGKTIPRYGLCDDSSSFEKN